MLATLLAAATVPSLLVSSSQVSITPPEPLPLGGYTQRGSAGFEAGGEDLFARTLILRQGETEIALTSVEMLTVPESLYAEVKERIPSGLNLFLAATHTHSAPDSQMLNARMTFPVPGIATYNSRWLAWYADRIAEGIAEAYWREPTAASGVDLRTVYLDLNRGRRLGALPDRAFTAIEVGGVRVSHFAAHAVFHDAASLRLSGDWPGAMGFTLVGAIGDVSPDAPGADSAAKIEAFAHTATQALSDARPARLEPWPLVWTEETIELDVARPHPEFANAYGIPQPLAESIVGRFAPPEAKVGAFRIGKLAIVGIPGEPTSHLGREIRDAGRRIGFSHVLVCSHVNGWMGYILGPEDYDRGGYEATLAFHGREQGTAVVQAAIAALKDLATAPKAARSGS